MIMTLNVHIEHPEDCILTGDLSVIDSLYASDNHISVKIDGAPAIVWGIHPKNGKFFVCTKSAFNKNKIKICYTPADINTFFGHQKNVSEILHQCLKYLPRTEGVYQGDFIGFGGNTGYQPNTIIYEFNEPVFEDIIIAPHTYYTGDGFMHTLDSHPLQSEMISTENCLFVQPFVDRVANNISAPNIDADYYEFLTEREAKVAKQEINSLIREGKSLHESDLIDILGSLKLANLYMMVVEMKHEIMEDLIVYSCPNSYIDGKKVNQEGFVMNTSYGMIKLVDREQFSRANFIKGRFQK